MAKDSVKTLMMNLKEDPWRKQIPFSPDIQEANKIILSDFASDAEKSEALGLWLRRNQPCIFGRIAASDRMHYCILSTSDLYSSDNDIKAKIISELLLWKRRCALNEKPEHGFMLLVADEKICAATPDDNLRRLACRIRELWGCKVERSANDNDIAWESTYLETPFQKDNFAVFTFSLDYFGSQGDQRWWHDHRVPGGIAFTANSLGHMIRYREWYENKVDQIEWGLQTAMLTVANAADVPPSGKAIWLKPLKDGRPFNATVPVCPFSKINSLKQQLQDKDWSQYRGWLSTDHSIRWGEFFNSGPERPKSAKEWNQDLTYIYDATKPDWSKFMGAQFISRKQLYDDFIGEPNSWAILAEKEQLPNTPEHDEILKLLSSLREKWKLQESEL